MAYGSTPYVGMAPKKNGGHIKSEMKTATAKNTDRVCMLPGEVLGRVLLEQKVYVRIPKLTTCSLQVQQFLLTFTP